MITLGNQQKEALDKIITFCLNEDYSEDNLTFSLTGYPGTGKSFCISYLLNKLDSLNYPTPTLSALTHKAAVVLKEHTQQEAYTLHSVLVLKPNIKIEDLDLKNLKFYREHKAVPKLSYHGLLIIDEASMISDNLFNVLITMCKEYETKILFVSDKKQLQPVNSYKYSKVYSCKNNYNLTEIFRQEEGNPLIDVLTFLRNKPILKAKFWKNGYQSEKGSMNIFYNEKLFLENCINNFKEKGDYKLLCYTNEQVKHYNELIKKELFSTSEKYPTNCILTGYCNVTEGNKPIIYNSDDYVVVDAPLGTKKFYFHYKHMMLNGYYLTLYELRDESQKKIQIFMLNENNDFDTIAEWIEQARQEALKDRTKWKTYFRLHDAFCSPIDIAYYDGRIVKNKTLDYGYAITTHKSQGSTYDKVMIDMKDIYKQGNLEELRQLQYVALSRTRKDVSLYL